ncbi:MAG TPA: hypothetical protein VF942_00955 [Acidimicrobiales bacterium]
MHPRSFQAPPHIWAEIEAIQAELLEELRGIDQQVEGLIARRREIEAELLRCRDAFGRGGGYPYVRRVPLPGELDAVPQGTRPISGRELRETASQLIVDSDRPLTLSEIHRILLAHGLHAEGRPSKTISDALKPEVAAGRLVRTGRGTYWGAAR